MFTLRFKGTTYKGESRPDSEHVIAAHEYHKDPRDKFAFVIVNGVEYQVGDEHPSHMVYAVCFVENQAGKTIDRIGPFNVQ